MGRHYYPLNFLHVDEGVSNPWWDPNGDGLCIWSAYAPKGAASFAASLLDLSGNGNNATDPGGAGTPGWDAVNGWYFDANEYLTTTFVPQNDQSQSAVGQYSGASNPNNGFVCGLLDGVDQYFGLRTYPFAALVTYYNGSSVAVAPAQNTGNLCVAGNQGYRNGVADGGAIGAWVGATALTLDIGNQNPARNRGLMGYIQAVAFYDCTLTAPQVLAVATAMAAL